MMSGRMIRFQLDCPQVFALRGGPVAVKEKFRVGQSSVRFRQVIIDLQGRKAAHFAKGKVSSGGAAA